MPELKRTIVSLSPDQHEWLRTKAFKDRMSMAEIVRQLIERDRRREAKRSR